MIWIPRCASLKRRMISAFCPASIWSPGLMARLHSLDQGGSPIRGTLRHSLPRHMTSTVEHLMQCGFRVVYGLRKATKFPCSSTETKIRLNASCASSSRFSQAKPAPVFPSISRRWPASIAAFPNCLPLTSSWTISAGARKMHTQCPECSLLLALRKEGKSVKMPPNPCCT